MNFFTKISSSLAKIFPFGKKDTFPSRFANKRILIVEDDVPTLEATERTLNRRSFKTLGVTSGERALEFLEKETTDLILLDSRLPGRQGPDICRTLKGNEKTKHIPIIFLTVVDSSENIIKSFDFGADNYLIKPVSPERLITEIERIFSEKH